MSDPSLRPEFWIIFDTGTKPEYYADVHEILALPRGSILRYDYRRKYLTDQAEEAVFGEGHQPDNLLLVYAQSSSFVRGAEPPSGEIPADVFFVPTRLARLLLIPTGGDESAYFDISVGGYPDPRDPAFDTIMESLLALGATPFRKWVAISDRAREYASLSTAASDAHWEQIVERLATPPAQFGGDVFWRLGAPTQPPESRQAIREDLADGEGNIYQLVSRYKLYQGHEAVLPVVSHMPLGTAGGADERRFAEVSSRSSKVQVVGSGRIELRRYSQGTARVRATHSDDASTTSEVVSFATPGAKTAWPMGPTFDLAFQVSKRPWRLVLGLVLISAVVVFGALGGTSEGGAKVVFLVLAAIATVFGGLALTGKLSKP